MWKLTFKNKLIERKDYITQVLYFLFKYSLNDKNNLKLIKYYYIIKLNTFILQDKHNGPNNPLSDILNIKNNNIENDRNSDNESF